MTAQLCSYDFTYPKSTMDINALFTILNEWCKKYVFQLEKSDSGYIHWQGRVSLIKKRRIGELAELKFLVGGRVSMTSTTVHNGNTFNYVMKADSRIEGPFSEKDYELPPVLTRQLRYFNEQKMYPWQISLLHSVTELEDRFIKLIYDPVGNIGKSIFCEYLEYHRHAYEIPPFRQMEDIMQCCFSIKDQKCYLIDMPRGMKKDKLGEFYAGLECLKNGTMYDKRYTFKKRRIDRPQIIVFTNMLPVFDLLTPDRWKIYDVKNNCLIERP